MKKFDIEKMAQAIEADAGVTIPALRESLGNMKNDVVGRRYTPAQLLVRAARNTLHANQKEFAALIETPLPTLRDWEQGRSEPSGAAKTLFKIIISKPESLLEHVA